MLAILDAINQANTARENQKTRRKSCEGSTAKGHYRTYAGEQVWIEAHERTAHTRRYAR
jgi:hypothetical protein